MAKVKTIIHRAPRDTSAKAKPRRRVAITFKRSNYDLISAEAKRLNISLNEYIRIRLNCQEVEPMDEQVAIDGITLSNKELNDLADKHLKKVSSMAN